jgi:hypothetical protein
MGRDRAPSAQALQEGTLPHLLALDPRRDLLPDQNRLPMAADAKGLPILADRLPRLPPLDQKRHLWAWFEKADREKGVLVSCLGVRSWPGRGRRGRCGGGGGCRRLRWSQKISALAWRRVSDWRGQTSSGLRVLQKLSMAALSWRLPRRLMEASRPTAWRAARKFPAAYRTARSEWKSRPGGGVRCRVAIERAEGTSAESMVGPMAQPTILRLWRSITPAR